MKYNYRIKTITHGSGEKSFLPQYQDPMDVKLSIPHAPPCIPTYDEPEWIDITKGHLTLELAQVTCDNHYRRSVTSETITPYHPSL